MQENNKEAQKKKEKGVTFGHVAAIKNKLEKDPHARLTKEERTDTKATQVKTTFRPAMKRTQKNLTQKRKKKRDVRRRSIFWTHK